MRAAAEREGLDLTIGSAGTGGWHVGHPPDERAIAMARSMGIDIGGYCARQVAPGDFTAFSHIYALDSENLSHLRAMRPAEGGAELSLLLDHVPGMAGRSVADPYYGGPEGFEQTWRQVELAARHLAHLFRA